VVVHQQGVKEEHRPDAGQVLRGGAGLLQQLGVGEAEHLERVIRHE